MFFYNSDKNPAKKIILTAPLDWGLGHATRSIPVITALNLAGHQVIIAAEGPVKSLLEHEFPDNQFISLKGYRIRYQKWGIGMPYCLFLQFPSILYRIIQEHFWLKRIAKAYSVDAIIADNRPGLFHKSIPCVYITHQLFIKTGHQFTEKIATKLHQWFIAKYNFCWVPDVENDNNLAGDLSHPVLKFPKLRYIGWLSRFKKMEGIKKEYDLLILISGPEPHRSIFESLVLKQIKNLKGKVLLVRGLPGKKNRLLQEIERDRQQPLMVKDHLDAAELSTAIQQAQMLICRAGYTTVMDLVKLKQKAILVPTPGQSEQEYLASYLKNKHLFYTVNEEDLNITQALEAAEKFPYYFPEGDTDLFQHAIRELMDTVQHQSMIPS